MKIVVTQRLSDYHACLADNTAIWGCGKSPSEAIGDLIRSHRERFQITIEEK
jgi:hypothetical protein